MPEDSDELTRVVSGVHVPARGTYKIDPVHTFVRFGAQHLVVGRVRGRLVNVAGTIVVGESPIDLTLDVEIDPASVTTLNDVRDADLRSPRFLDVATFPKMTYRSKSATVSPQNRWLIAGELRLRNIARIVQLEAALGGVIVDSQGMARVGYHATGSLTRTDFGLTTDLEKETGGIAVSEDVVISIDVEATRSLT
ncbi:YceI family protein [bacterium]|nr:MAG: YceI family protein [bacterium]